MQVLRLVLPLVLHSRGIPGIPGIPLVPDLKMLGWMLGWMMDDGFWMMG